MSEPLEDTKLTLIEDFAGCEDLLTWLGERREYLGFDIETTGVNLGKDRIRLVQFGDPSHGWAMSYTDWKGVAREVINRYDRPMVAHNLIFDSKFLKRDGITVPQRLAHDTMVMAHLYEPRHSIALKSAAARYVDPRAWMGKDLLSQAFTKGGWNWATIPEDHPSYWVYSAMDTVLTSALASKLWPKIQPYRHVYEVELGCIHVLRDAALRGVRIDLDYTRRVWHWLEEECARLEALVPCDPGKDRQVIAMITDLCKPRDVKEVLTHRTKSGGISVDDDALAAVQDRWPHIIAPLREWRKKAHIKRNYIENLLSMHAGGIVYPSVKPLGARTGRMSVTEPALQTLPRGKIVRNCFIAREDNQLVLADYKQIELRVLAAAANEEAMIATFKRDEDLHQWTAGQVYEKPQDQVTYEERQLAKNTGFANVYGAGIPQIARTAGCALAVAEAFMQRYDQLFPGVAHFKQKIIDLVMERWQSDGDGYILTKLGRRLPVEKEKAYAGVNYYVQSTATADVLKLKLIELDSAGLGDFIILPVHDEVLFDVPTEALDFVRPRIAEVMPERNLFTCPLEIEMETVYRWGDAYEE